MLTNGQCTEDFICGTNKSFYTCIPPLQTIPPECPDNCTGHGMCVNVSYCKTIEEMQNGALVTPDGTVYLCDPSQLNQTLLYNQSKLCACVNGFSGVNCIVPVSPLNIALAAGLAAGLIALFVILGVLALALCGGGAYAATTALAAGGTGGLLSNPTYEAAGTTGSNPLAAGSV